MSDEMRSSLEGLGYGFRLIMEADLVTVAGCAAALCILLALCALF